jgi:hypothetical protein
MEIGRREFREKTTLTSVHDELTHTTTVLSPILIWIYPCGVKERLLAWGEKGE